MEHYTPNPPESNQQPSPIPVQEVKSYTAPPYDRYQGASGSFPPPHHPPKEPVKKTVPLTTSVLTSVVVSLVSSVLVFCVMMYGVGIGDLFDSQHDQTTTSSVSESPSGGSTTNIVVDATAQTSAEAVSQKVGPSVVGIAVTSGSSAYFFGYEESASEGSGIVYTADGTIITNFHVVESAVKAGGKVSVYLQDDTQTAHPATVVGYDVSSDLAVLKINQTGLTPVEIGDSDQLKVGQTAIAIGNPGGLQFMGSVSMGIISGLDRTLQLENSATEINLIQTDAAINPGNSGGALVNISGQLIGINSAKMASENFEGMGFAIPVNDAVAIVDRLIQNEDTPTPYLGVEISTYYDAETLQMMGYPPGVVVATVIEGGPAHSAGLQRGDIITHFGDTQVTDYTEFTSAKNQYKPGDTVTLTVYRSGKTGTLSITLGTANQ